MSRGQIPRLPEAELLRALELARTDAVVGLRVADLADAAGYSPHHFSRLFLASMGISPAQYVSALRIDAAKRALLSRSDPVIDIATAVGFASLSSFTRRFRDVVGLPPAKLRHLADDVAATTLSPFTLIENGHRDVRVRLEFPPDSSARREPGVPQATWVGWFPQPYPMGLPAQGELTWADELSLPLCPGNPWLLAYTVATSVDVVELLVPTAPLVARNDQPIVAPQEVLLRFEAADPFAIPLLPALPQLRHIAASRR
ncbi:helix-turn-helix transcriptional regulator [Dietzia alimentaria]|uniref:helix-turn-helix transcriptional regulator n=1 Tax=Dietzia alimentaria TaxID=665550 RepID=UPI00029A95E2|nr:helix-turn-helix transcriptional regulator [Dietzia alimentaria]